MIPLPTLAPILIAAAVGAAGGYVLAAKIAAGETARLEARRIECEHARGKDARAAAEKAAALLARAQDAEAISAQKLAAARAEADRKLKETRRDLYRLTSGRECLSGPLRLRLNTAIAADDLPTRAGDADPAAAGAVGDPILHSPPGRGDDGEGATDTDLAHWILDAASRYDDCRARIDAIREWDAMTYGGAHGR